jgi:hypothetical protein
LNCGVSGPLPDAHGEGIECRCDHGRVVGYGKVEDRFASFVRPDLENRRGKM